MRSIIRYRITSYNVCYTKLLRPAARAVGPRRRLVKHGAAPGPPDRPGRQRDRRITSYNVCYTKLLRDPLRVLRVARFAARFHRLGFGVAPETLALMQQMTDSGELAHLTPERVWKELEKVLTVAMNSSPR